jgi:hypothetical protein
VLAAPNLYRVEADSETRIRTIEQDCTNKGASNTVLNYTDIVITGNIAMRDGGVPNTFPETTVEFLENSLARKSLSTQKGRGSFKTVIPGGEYSIRITLNGTPVKHSFPKESINRSCKKTLHIDSHVSRIMGNISTVLGTSEGQTSVSIYRADNGALVQTKEYGPGAAYEFYLNPNNYDIVVSNPNYTKLSKKSVTAFGDISVNFRFTHAPITFQLQMPKESTFWGSYLRLSQNGNADNLFSLCNDPFAPRDHLYTVTADIELGRTLYVAFTIEEAEPDPDETYEIERKSYVFSKAATVTPF